MKTGQKTGLLLFLAILLIACSSNDGENVNTTVSTNETGTSEDVPENEVRITISINDGEQYINEQQVEIADGANLLEVLEDTFFVETDEADEIISIERMRVNEDDGTSWHLYVDGELADIPAKDYVLTGGEKIILDLN